MYPKMHKMENSKFSKKCHKKGGYFKCCIADVGMEKTVDVRVKLIKDGLINDKPEDLCKQTSTNKNPCMYCINDFICTIKNPLTGQVKQMFYPEKKERTPSDKVKSKFICLFVELIWHWFLFTVAKASKQKQWFGNHSS